MANHSKENVSAIYPLSPLQQGLVFHNMLAPDSGVYVLRCRCTLTGPLDSDALRAAWEQVTARYDVLRTLFVLDHGGQPLQVVLKRVDLDWQAHDWSHLPSAEQDARFDALERADAARGFAITEAPLFRVAIASTGPRTHRLLWSMHHAIVDGWSISLILRDLLALYETIRNGRPIDLPPVRPYADYIAWLGQQDRAAAERYWRRALKGFTAPIDAPLASGTQQEAGRSGETLTFAIDRDTTSRLHAFARAQRLTLNTLIQGAWAVMLSRYSSQADVVFGTTVAGRPPSLAGAESMVGLLINTVPVRAEVRADQPLVSWLRDIQADQSEARQYEFCSLVDVQRWSDVPRGHALFDTLLLFESFPPIQTGEGDGERLAVQSVDCADPTHYGLTLAITPGETLIVRLLADRRFDRATLERMAAHFDTVLRSMLAGGDRRVGDLAILPSAEQEQVVSGWNATAVAYGPAACLHELVEAQVARTPTAPALWCDGGTLTYAELDARANQLARVLRGRGIGPEARVGVCLERSFDLVIALLATLKAGGAYVPLDPGYPVDRLAFMVADARPAVVVTTKALADRVRTPDATLVCVDVDAVAIAAEAAGPLAPAATPASLAYIIYTSGSTGRPKGAMNGHAAIVNRLRWMQQTYGLDATDAVLQKTPFSFDVSVWEFFWPLMTGARLVIAKPAGHQDPAYLARLIASERITTVHFVPSMLQVFLQALGHERCATLKRVICSGEALPLELQRAFFERCDAELHNLYGPTEAAVDVTFWRCVSDEARGIVPIGRPVANTRIYVLDDRGAIAPIGVPGELFIGGVQVGRGYFRRPELTAETFVPDPFGGRPGARLYRTGDRARWRADGTVEYLGRLDHQIKLRGFRIELGEIEAVLQAHDGVEQALVALREDTAGDPRLIAYLLAPGAGPAVVTALKALVTSKLPQYMHPSAYVMLEAFPLTPNGKIDRRALPAPAGDRQVADAYVAPTTSLEQRIAAVWRDVLRIEQAGVRDNFFDLGGHSLLLMQVHARLSRELGRPLAMTELFQYPTIEALARHLAGADVKSARIAEAESRVSQPRPSDDHAIAIIGMAGRFPGAADLEAFWANLRNGTESIRSFTDEELTAAGADRSLLRDPRFVKARGVIDDVDLFDAAFFGFTPREAELLDPQQRVFLECAWEALERAGYDSSTYPGEIGVYAGSSLNSYILNVLATANPGLLGELGGMQALMTADKDHLPTRVSYKLNLRGPSMNIQTACSTSLVAAHAASQAILAGECDMALAGGVSITVPVVGGYLYEDGGIMSPDGHCRAFDSRAGGMVGGNGVGVVVLKRLDRALADGDAIHAVIRGTAVKNDGSMKVGYTAPSVDGQAKVIAAGLAAARVDPATISYVEAHAAGTPLGDPLEMQALTQVYRERTDKVGYCAVGSVKTNIGHLDAAAGVAALIKTALALRHEELPPSLNFEQPSPQIDFATSPFFVNTALRPWPAQADAPRRAAVSAFGLGGTNAHAILEQAPLPEASGASRDHQILTLSAKTASALDAAASRLANHLAAHDELPVADVAYTLHVGRKGHAYRLAAVCRTTDEAVDALRSRDARRLCTGIDPSTPPRTIFLFPAEGAQYVGMASGLYETEPAYRTAFDECGSRFKAQLGIDVRALLYDGSDAADDRAARLDETAHALASLFSVEYALARLWLSWGIRPAALIGHGVGEYVAACVSGALTLDDAVALVAVRARVGGLPAASVTAAFGAVAAAATFRTPLIPYVSNVTGDWIGDAQLQDRSYFARHAAGPVEFAAGVRRLLDWGASVFLEVGPGQTLSALVRQQSGEAGAASGAIVIASLADSREETSDALTVPDALARLWTAGVAPDWSAYHAAERRRRVELPTYPFERKRYWIDSRPDAISAPPRSESSRHSDVADWFAIPSWKRTLLPAPLEGSQGQSCLLFTDAPALGAELVRRFESSGCRVALVEPGEGFARLGADRYSIAPGERADWATLLRHLADQGAAPQVVVYAALLDSLDPETASFFGPLHLAQAFADAAVTTPARIDIITSAAFDVTGGERVAPERALALGPARVIGAELPTLTCRMVDVSPSWASDVAGTADAILRESNASDVSQVIAYRHGRRWVQTFEPVTIPAPASEPAKLRHEGVYLITGGLGAIGLALAGYLARACAARLVLVGRGALPARDEWAARLEHGDATVGRIRAVLDLERAGAIVEIVQADVASEPEMRAAVQRAIERFGRLDGVIHAAGIAAGGIIELKDRAAAAAVLAPKVAGARALERALDGRRLDFLILCSSIDSVLGGAGQIDYCAANAYLDAFAAHYAAKTGNCALAINWDTWAEGDMAIDANVGGALRREQADALRSGLSNAEGLEVFRRALSIDGQTQLVVSTRPLSVRGGSRVRTPGGEHAAADASGYDRPALAASYVAPRNDIEAAIAETWQDLFGIARIGVFDNFFELGGHSLLATQVASRLRRTFSIELALASVFDSPTVAGLADLVFERLLEQEAGASLLLDDVQRLAPSEGGRELSGSSTGL